VTAVDAAAIDDEEQHAIGVLVDDRWRRVVRVLAERIAQLLVADVGLGGARDRLEPDRAARVHRIHEARVVRREADAEQLRRGLEPGALLRGQRDHARQLVGGRQHVAELPAPVVPLRVRNVGAGERRLRR